VLFVGPGHGDLSAFQPAAGVAMSFDDLKVIEAHRFVQAVLDGEVHGASIIDAVAGAAVLEAIEQSAQARRLGELGHDRSFWLRRLRLGVRADADKQSLLSIRSDIL
jgi:hypothetical protein